MTYVSFIPFFVFGFWSLLAMKFEGKVMKVQKYYLTFVYILELVKALGLSILAFQVFRAFRAF